MLNLSSNFLPTVPRRCFFVTCVSCYSVILSCLVRAALCGSPAGKGLTSWLSYIWYFFFFVTFPYGVLGLIVLIPTLRLLSYFGCDSLSLSPRFERGQNAVPLESCRFMKQKLFFSQQIYLLLLIRKFMYIDFDSINVTTSALFILQSVCPSFSSKRGKPRFPLERWALLDFLSSLNSYDEFYLYQQEMPELPMTHARFQKGTEGPDPPPPPWKITFSNTGPNSLKNHKANTPAFNVGASSACQQNAI